MTPNDLKKQVESFKPTPPMPVLFVGHGSPMNAIEDNGWTRAWEGLGKGLPRPQAILCVSAHWFVDETAVHFSPAPRTIHDFYGFPKELYDQRYGCPGSPAGAREVRGLVKSADVRLDEEWGLDHGAWVPLARMFPAADVPVFQLSLDYRKPSRFHYELGKELASLRSRGVLVVASGNMVHNLGMIDPSMDDKPFDWAGEFDATLAALIEKGDDDALIGYEKLGHAAQLAIPSPDHYWPLLYALAMRAPGEEAEFFNEGSVFGSVSMRSLKFSS
jgi:4,5-DOPA dioxygenase extradiol